MDEKLATEMLYKKHGKLYVDKDIAAHELNIGRATLDRMRQSGEIKASKIRGNIRFSLTEIAKFIRG